MESLRRNHRALDAVLRQRFAYGACDFPSLEFAERFSRDHISVVRRPVADADHGEFADDFPVLDSPCVKGPQFYVVLP
jgi:hypothetical protein